VAHTHPNSRPGAEGKTSHELDELRRNLAASGARIKELEKAAAQLAQEKDLVERVARGEPPAGILAALCELIESRVSGSVCEILLFDPSSGRLGVGAAPSLPKDYTAALQLRLAIKQAGPPGLTVSTKRPVVAADIASDPRWQVGDWSTLALAHGLRACWSSPILAPDDRVLGVCGIYWWEPRSPTGEEQRSLGPCLRIASLALEQDRKSGLLRESEERYRRIFDAVPGMICTLGARGEVELLNRQILDYFGKSLDELRNWAMSDAVHPDDLPGLIERFTHSLATGTPLESEQRQRRHDGVYRWQLSRARPFRDANGRVIGWHQLITDVDDRMKAEEALQRSEAYLSEAQRLSHTGSFGWQVETGELTWSAETYRIMGYDSGMHPTLRDVLARVHPEDRELVQHAMARASAGLEDVDFMHRLLMPDGAIKHVHVVTRMGKDRSGKAEVVGALMDITEQQQAKAYLERTSEALRSSEQFSRAQAEALRHILDALARESSQDRIIEHVLGTITAQLDAHSCSVWSKDTRTGMLNFEFSLVMGEFRTKTDIRYAASFPSERAKDIWAGVDIFNSGRPQLLDDIRDGPDFPWRAELLAQGIISVLVVPMLVSGQVSGVVGIRFTQKRRLRSEEVQLAQTLANQAMLAMQLSRISAQSRVTAVLAERNRMARDIHDTLAQGFTGVIVQLEAAADAAAQGLPNEAAAHLQRARDRASESLMDARRSVQALRPQALEQRDLCAALKQLTRRMSAQTSLKTRFSVTGVQRPLPEEWEDNLLRICQESLTNTLRHARADEFLVQVAFAEDEVRLELGDNGRGFEVSSRSEGFGLIGIRERVQQMGGKLEITSTPGQGSRTLIILSCENQSD
jgi:PAS domain S-box-containing protein